MRLYRRGRVYWVAYHDHATKRVERISTRCTDRSAAESFGRRLERDSADPDGSAAATATLAGALDAMMTEYQHRMRERRNSEATVEFYRKRGSQLLRMVKAGKLPPLLSDLTARHVDDMIDQRRAERAKSSTIAKDLITLKIALKLAKRRGEWTGDVDQIMPHRFGGQSKAVERYLTPAELWALLGALPPARAAHVAFSVAVGANLSEAAKARREDVKASTVHLRGTKRKKRDRHVPIEQPWQRVLLAAALSALPDEGELFEPWISINQSLLRASKRAGIPRLSTNDLRRTFGTWLRADGVRPDLIASAMGHTDSRMVETTYARLDVEQLRVLLTPRPAVPILYADQAQSTDPAHSPNSFLPDVCAESGSDCWTRTSDPVINSHRVSSHIAAEPWEDCADPVHERPTLAKAMRRLGIDAAEWLAAGGEQ